MSYHSSTNYGKSKRKNLGPEIPIRINDSDYEDKNTTATTKPETETADIIESESMDSHGETLVSDKIPDALDAYYGKSKPQYPGAFKAMTDRGIHFTSYVETGGDGRVTRSYSDSSNSSPDSQRKISAPRPFKESSESELES